LHVDTLTSLTISHILVILCESNLSKNVNGVEIQCNSSKGQNVVEEYSLPARVTQLFIDSLLISIVIDLLG